MKKRNRKYVIIEKERRLAEAEEILEKIRAIKSSLFFDPKIDLTIFMGLGVHRA